MVGAFARGGDTPDWTGGVYALQNQVGLTVHVGSLTALELQGRAHFVPLGRKHVLLVSDRQERLPSWFRKYDWKVDVVHRCMASLFDSAINLFVRNMPRISVDIDLTYLPLESRDASLTRIGAALKSIKSVIEADLDGTVVNVSVIQGHVPMRNRVEDALG